jgi:AcrR family transcriptional regulator
MEEDSESTRDRIISAAIRAFADGDYEGTSIRDVARAARVSLPVIYYYFHSKEGLYDYVMRHCRLSYVQTVQAALAAVQGLRGRLRALIQARQALIETHRSMVILLIREQFSIYEWTETLTEISPALSVTFEVVQELLQESIREGEIPGQDDESAAWSLVGILGVFDLQVLNRGRSAGEPEIEHIVELAMHGLSGSPAGVGSERRLKNR